MTKGIPYFPLDCQLDDKFALIEAEFGLTGFAVVVKLFQRIYGRCGYYCEFTNEVALLFGREAGLGGNAVSEIVSAAVRRGIFNKELFEKYHILTSEGIQKRYFEAVSRRKKVEVKKQYLLVNCAELLKNADISEENADIYGKNDNISVQSKEEKSKAEYSKEEKTAGGGVPPGFETFWNSYPKKISKQNALKAWEKLSPDNELVKVILDSLEKQKSQSQWTKDNGQYIPYPASWLEGRRWEDELAVNDNEAKILGTFKWSEYIEASENRLREHLKRSKYAVDKSEGKVV